jgi:hypothetical protein
VRQQLVRGQITRLTVNATGVFFGLKYAIPAMIASGLL